MCSGIVPASKTSTPELVLMIEAYLRLLKVPHSCSSRHRLQTTLASLRDEIAQVSGWRAERVQDACEAMVALLNSTRGEV